MLSLLLSTLTSSSSSSSLSLFYISKLLSWFCSYCGYIISSPSLYCHDEKHYCHPRWWWGLLLLLLLFVVHGELAYSSTQLLARWSTPVTYRLFTVTPIRWSRQEHKGEWVGGRGGRGVPRQQWESGVITRWCAIHFPHCSSVADAVCVRGSQNTH